MKNRPRNFVQSKSATERYNKKPPVPELIPISLFDRLEQWLKQHRYRVTGILVALWIAIRISMFSTVAGGPLYNMYQWPNSDNAFFDEWARSLAAGDWLNRLPLHPYHEWHQEFAEFYLKQHPDKLQQILANHPVRDSTFVPGKVLWNEWYGGNQYHQEPLYAYMLAVLYAITGNGVFWMMLAQSLLGVLSGVFLYLIARRYFGDTVALVTGLLYLFCGIILFQEALILRTSWSVFFTVYTIWMFDRALGKRTLATFFASGLSIGAAYLLQSVFLLFLAGALAIYGVQERKTPRLFVRNTAAALAGFVLVCSPLVLRNALVGAPLFSSSSVGAITFVVSNVHDTKAISMWAPEAGKCAEIMGKTDGDFGAAVVETLRTHPSISEYLDLQWSKCQRIIQGLEWPNNENYYFYKQLVPALDIAFLNFYWLVWIGAAGLLFALYHRIKCPNLYLALTLQLILLLGFYVLGRFRTPLVALLLPFAAYGIVGCLRFAQNNWKVTLSKLVTAALCFYALTYLFYRPGVSMLDPTDYNVFYELNYYERVKSNAEAGRYGEAIKAHAEFLDYQPDIVRNARPGRMLKTASDLAVLKQFADHYQIHRFLYEDSGNTEMAAKAMARSNALLQTIEQSRRHLPQ